MGAVGRLVERIDTWLFGLAWPLPLVVVVSMMVVFALIALKKRSLRMAKSSFANRRNRSIREDLNLVAYIFLYKITE